MLAALEDLELALAATARAMASLAKRSLLCEALAR
jgi:hypothetical protein